MKKAIISTVTRGKFKGYFIFALCIQNADLRTIVAEGNNPVPNKGEVINTINCCFPDFEIEDESKDIQDFYLVD